MEFQRKFFTLSFYGLTGTCLGTLSVDGTDSLRDIPNADMLGKVCAHPIRTYYAKTAQPTAKIRTELPNVGIKGSEENLPS